MPNKPGKLDKPDESVIPTILGTETLWTRQTNRNFGWVGQVHLTGHAGQAGHARQAGYARQAGRARQAGQATQVDFQFGP